VTIPKFVSYVKVVSFQLVLYDIQKKLREKQLFKSILKFTKP